MRLEASLSLEQGEERKEGAREQKRKDEELGSIGIQMRECVEVRRKCG